jgi:hypothetical protein
MEHFVTLFNSLFLPQGLALHISMQRHIKTYVLWVLCVDDEVYRILDQLKMPNMRLLKLSELETKDLIKVKNDRSIGEYCWTLTPFAPRFVFEADKSVKRVTYLDADLWFRKNPIDIFKEFRASDKQVLITDHGYAPEYDQSAKSGRYCVQFMTFNREGCEDVRKWWEEQCIMWCYARYEDNKFGDQKYLEKFVDLFSNDVHILEDKGLALAPWNATRFPYYPSIFYHFQSFRIRGSRAQLVKYYRIPSVVYSQIYQPYLEDIANALDIIKKVKVIDFMQCENFSITEFIKSLMLIFARLYRDNRISTWKTIKKNENEPCSTE